MRWPFRSRAKPPTEQSVLVCVDQEHLARLIEVNVQRRGNPLFVAHSAEEALQWAAQELPPFFILGELRGPISSDELERRVREIPGLEEIRVMRVRGLDWPKYSPPGFGGPFKFA